MENNNVKSTNTQENNIFIMMADESDSDDKEMWLYLTQIQHLDKQLER